MSPEETPVSEQETAQEEAPPPHPTAAIGAGYNPFDPAFTHDPFPFYAAARRAAPVCFSEAFQTWVVTGHDEIVALTRDPALFSSASILDVPFPLPDEVLAVLHEGYYPMAPGLFNNDPPGHTRARALATSAFSHARIAAMEPSIRALAHALVDGFVSDGEADLLDRFAYPLPMTVIADLVGVEHREMAQVKAWHDEWMSLYAPDLSLEQQLKGARALVAYQRYYTDLIEDRKASPRDDLATALVEAHIEGETPFTTPEIVSQLIILLSAAHETTTSFLANMVRLLLEDPARWREVSADPALIPAAMDESLRFEPPVHMEPRVTRAQASLGGVAIPSGARVHAMYGAVGRDPALFEDPDRFDLHRPHRHGHMAFGHGIHYCLGAALARLEGRVALEVLKERLPGLRLAPGFAVEYTPSFFFRHLKRVDVQWDAPRAGG
jgi:cytochrome P450